MSNEGDPPATEEPQQQPQEPEQQQPAAAPEPQPAAAPEGGRAEGSASFLRAARAGDLEKVLELLRAGTDINTSNANGLNSLHLASKEGHSEVVRELIKRQAQVDAATRKGNTALHIASLAGQSLIVTILVENGANVNVQSVNGFTPLYMAAQENHEDVVRYLLNHGANQALSTEDGFTPLAVALQQGHDRVVAVLLENDAKGKVRLPALHIAAKKDDTKAATLLLQNEHNPDVTSKSGFTPLHIAAHYGHENVGKLLLDKGANVNYQARHNISPLHVATKWGRTNMANLLLGRGAIIDSRTKDLLTPLHCAARSGHDQVVDLLVVQGAPISAKTKNGLAPLHMAAQGDHVDAARTLLYHRAPVDDVTVDYLTPLHVAAHCGHVRVAKLLLDRSADPNARALNGFTPLHIACKKNRIKVVELLLKYRAAIEATTESGLTPLHVAAFMGAINIVIYLLQQGANPDVETVRGETPLHLAARANQTDVVRVLIRNGAKVDAQARELQTPLHIASRLGNTDIVVLLLQAGANSNATTRDNYSPLHIAAKEGQEEVAGILLDHNADKTLMTKKGFTPLHLASKYGNLEVVRLLLERGTPVDIEGKNQVTPLHVAAHYNNDKVAMLLLENGASAKAAAKNGYTPLHIAAKKNQMEIASTLLHYKADPNAKSRAGFTPLHLAAQEGHREISGLLIENGSDVGAKANNGLTAMHLCAQEDHVPVAQILHDSGAEINSKTNAGYTPLHVACHFGQLNMVKFLVEHGADVGEKTRASYTPLHQAAQQGHNNCVRYLLENGASPNEQTATGQTPLSIAQRLGYVSVVETLRTVTETTVITETTTVDDRYKPQNPEAMNETMFSESEDEGQAAEHEAAAAHAKDFSDNLTQGLQDSTGVHMIHTGEQLLQRSQELENGGAIPKVNSGGMSPDKEFAKIAPVATSSPIASSHSQPLGLAPRAGSISNQFQQHPIHAAGAIDAGDNIEELVRRAQQNPMHTASYENGASMLDHHGGHADNVPIGHHVTQPSFLISFLVDARGGAMRGCRHSGVRIIVPPRKASQPIRVTCRYLRKDKLAHPPPLSEGEELASRILEMAPAGAKFLGPVILEVPHFASLRDREREIVILRSDDGQHWKEHQLEATEDAVQEVLNESFDAEDLAQLDDLHTPRITRILTNDFPMYFAVVTRVRQEVHCVGPEGGVIISSVVPRVQAIFPDGSLTKTIKVSVQAQPVPQEMVTRLHGNRVAVSPIVTVEPRRRKFHKPITLCIPLPQSNNKGMLTQYSGQQGQEPPTLRLLCSITGGSAPAQWEDITGTTQLTFTGDEVSFTTTVSARFWLMDCQTPRDAARMAQEVYNEAISIPYMAKFAVFARRTFPVEGQLRVFCMTDDKEDKTLEKQEHFKLIAKSRDVEVLKGKHQFLEFSGNLVPITKSGDQLSLFFLPFQENRLAFMVKTRSKDDTEAATEGRIGFMAEPKIRSDALPPQQPICTLAISLPEYTGEVKVTPPPKRDGTPFEQRYHDALNKELPEFVHQNVLKGIGADWPRLGRALEVPHRDIQHIRHNYPGQECKNTLKIWIHLKKEDANQENLDNALRQIGRDDIVRSIAYGEPEALINYSQADSPSQKREPIRHFEDVPTATLVKREVRTEDIVTREPVHVAEPTVHHVEQTTVVQEPSYSAPIHHSPVPEEPEPEEEAPVAEMRTVVRTERHVHDTEDGPVVEERTITTTYEDDVAVNENIVDRTVPLNEEEQAKWEELNRLADEASPSPAQRSTVAESTSEPLPEDVEQSVESESHREDDGTIVTTTVTTSHISESVDEEEEQPSRRSAEPKDHGEEEHDEASGAEHHAGQDSGTTQKKETAEEGFTNEDGSVVVSKKMTRVVTTTRTTLPGEGEEPSAPESPVESLGSVKDRIAKFEQLKDFPPEPSTSGTGVRAQDEEEESVPAIQVSEPEHSGAEEEKEEHLQEENLQSPVGIVITPHTPIPPELPEQPEHPDDAKDDQDDEDEPREPLELSEPEHVAHAQLKDTREYSDEELAHELQPSEEHVSTAEVKDTKSYTPTSSDDERSQKGVSPSPPVPQVRHAISPSVASEVLSSHDDELAAHFVAESFEKHDEGRVETMEQTPVYKGHHSPGQTSPIVSEHPIAQEYAESVTSHDEGDNLSLKSGHEPEIARHSVESVQEEEEEGKGLGDYAKKAGMIVGGVIAAPVALAAVGAKAAYDALKKDDGEEEEPEEKEVLTTTTTIMESPIRHEDITAPHVEEITARAPHHEEASPVPSERHIVTETTTTVTREYQEGSPVESPVVSEKEPFEESFSPAPSSHVESERPVADSPAVSEKDHVVETTTTTIVTREYEEEPEAVAERRSPSPAHSQEHLVTETTTTVTREFYREPAEQEIQPIVVSHEVTAASSKEITSDWPMPIASSQQREESPVESVKEEPHLVTETTTTTTVTREFYDEPEEQETHSPAPSSHVESERPISESPAISEKELPHVVETTTTTTVTREFHEEEEPEKEHHEPSVVETTTTTVTREFEQPESPAPSEKETYSPAPVTEAEHEEGLESPMSVKEPEPHLISETTTTTTVTREFYDEPEERHHEAASPTASPAPSSHVESERPISESPAISEKELPHVVETTTTTTVTREFHEEEEPEKEHHEPSVVETTTTTVTREFEQPESPAPSEKETYSPAPVTEAEHEEGLESPMSVKEPEPHLISETTTTTTVTREFYDEPEERHHEAASPTASPAPSSHVESERPIAESPAISEKELPHVVETTTTTTVTREYEEEPEAAVERRSPSPADSQAPFVTETTTTTTITREYFDEPEEHEQEPQAHSPAPSSHVESEHQIPESPAVSEKEYPHVVETITSTTVTREFHDEEESDRPESEAEADVQPAHWTETTTTTTTTREVYEEPEEEEKEAPPTFEDSPNFIVSGIQADGTPIVTGAISDVDTADASQVHEQMERHAVAESPAAQYFHEQPEQRRSDHDEDDEESDGEGFGKKALGFAKKAGMVAGGVVAAPVALAAFGAKAAYDALKKDGDEEEHHEPLEEYIPEATTSSTWTSEYLDDDEEEEAVAPAAASVAESPAPSEKESIPQEHHEEPAQGSPEVSEKEFPTTTTTTVTREYQEEAPESPVPSEKRFDEEPEAHLITETTTTTTVTREYYDEPELIHHEAPEQESYSPAPSSHVESERPIAESPAISEKELPHVVETTTTTTVTREYEEEPEAVVEGRSPSPADSQEHLVTETTTTVTREFYREPAEQEIQPIVVSHEVTAASSKEITSDWPMPIAPSQQREESPVESVKEEPHLVTETTTTTTVTREFYDEPEEQETHSPAPSSHVESERPISESPAISEKELPHVVETTTTTTVTREFHEEEDPERPQSGADAETTHWTREAYDEPAELHLAESPVTSEKPLSQRSPITETTITVTRDFDDTHEYDDHHVVESSTTITVTRDYEHPEEEPAQSAEQVEPVTAESQANVEPEHPESPDQSEKDTYSPVAEREEGVESPVSVKDLATEARVFNNEPEAASSPAPSSHVESERPIAESPDVFEVGHVVETKTTTKIVREFFEEMPSGDSPARETTELPELVKENFPYVVETTTTTTVTREYDEEPEPVAKGRSSLTGSEEPSVSETTTETVKTTTSISREYFDPPTAQYEQPEHETESPVPTEHAPLLTEQAHPEHDDEESDGEGFGSKMLGFAKKAGMVAGAVVAAPVALAAVGAKTAYDALKKDGDEGEDQEEQEALLRDIRERRALESPAASEKDVPQFEQEHPITHESPVPSEPTEQHPVQESPVSSEPHHVTETTTTTTVIREFFNEPESPVASEKEYGQPAEIGSPVESERSIPHVVETTTTTTVTRDFDEETAPESPVPSEGEPETTSTTITREFYEAPVGAEPEHHYTETTTTTVTRHVYDEPEEVEGEQEPKAAVEEKTEVPHVVETTTTTTVTREFHDDDEEKEHEPSEHGAFPTTTETTTTTTVTREFYGEEEPEVDKDVSQSPVPSEKEEGTASPTSESFTSVSRETHQEEPHVIETTTTTTVTREFHDEPEEEGGDRQSPVPSEGDLVKETTTTSTVTREFYDEPVAESTIPSEKDYQESTQELGSPVESEKFHHEAPEQESYSPAPSSHVESERPIAESPAISEKELPHVVETTTTTTVTREYEEEPEAVAERRSPSPAHSQEHLVTETTTTVTREFYREPAEQEIQPIVVSHEVTAASSKEITSDWPMPIAQSQQREESPVESVKEEPHLVTETTTTTTVTREFYDEPEEQETHSPAPSSHVESERPISESPAISEKELPHVVETTTTTTITREFHDEEDPQHEISESPAAQYFREQPEHETESPVPMEHAPLLTEQAHPEHDDEESDGEGFGSKMLGFAKKAGMVAGAVVVAPVALAAVGAKTAYDALKKDDDEGEDQEEQEALLGDIRERRALESPAASEKDVPQFEQEHPITHESPVPSEPTEQHPVQESPVSSEPHHVTETTTTTTVIREFYDEPESPVTSEKEFGRPAEVGSPVESERSLSHVVETTTTTTVTRGIDEEEPEEPVDFEKDEHLKQFQGEESPSSSDKDQEAEQKPDIERQGSYSSGYSPKSPQGSPVESDDESRPVIETTTTTTTTVTHEVLEEPEGRSQEAEAAQDLESPVESEKSFKEATGTHEHFEEERVSPTPSEEAVTRVVETTTTTTVTREHFEPEEHQFEHSEDLESPRKSPYEQPTEYGRVDSHDAPASPAPSVESTGRRSGDVEHHEHHVIETTTTTSVTREYEHPEEESERLSEPTQSPAPEEHEVVGTPAESEKSHPQDFNAESPVPSEKDTYSPAPVTAAERQEELESPVSVKEEPHLIGETTTTTTVTREFYDEPEERHHEATSPTSSSAPSSHVESERPIAESPAISEKEVPHVFETTTTTTVTREFYEDEPEHEISESPAAQYFHEQPEHVTESPVPTEHAPLLTEQTHPEHDDEESDGEGFGSKMLGFAKKAGMVAGAVVAAPVALAAVGAKTAYDALKKDDDEGEDQEEQEALLGDIREQRTLEEEDDEETKTLLRELRERLVFTPVTAAERAALEAAQEHPITQESPVPTEPTEQHSVQEPHHVTETTTTTTVTREYFDEPEEEHHGATSPSPAPSSHVESEAISEKEIPHVVETTITTTVTREYHDDEFEQEGAKSPVPSEGAQPVETTTTVTREVYEAPEGVEPEHHYVETTTTTTVTKDVYEEEEPEEKEVHDAPESPLSSERAYSEKESPVTETSVTVHREEYDGDSEQPHVVETTTTTVTRELYEEPEGGVRPPSGSEADDESHAPRYLETTTTTTVTREYEVSEDEEDHGEPVQREGSPAPSEESVTRVVEKTTTTTVTEEHIEPEESHIVESQEYTGSPVPSEEESHGFIKTTTTTTTVTREHFDDEPVHQGEEGAASPVPSEESVSRVVETTTTVTKEHFEPEEGVIESQEYASGSPVPSEEGSSRIIETTTTTVTREHFEPEEDHHIVESREYSATGSPVPSEKSVGRVVETTTTTTVTREHLEEEPTHEAPASPVPSEEGVSRVVETTTTTVVTHEHFEQDSPLPSQESHIVESQEYFTERPYDAPGSGSPMPSEEVLARDFHEPVEGDDEESDGEGFGSKMLGFAKKAGMVAGAVVAAPVALAAVGAKTAYDALKKDDDEEERESRAVDSETQEPGATFYEPEEEDRVIESSEYTSAAKEEQKIITPRQSMEEYSHLKESPETAAPAEEPFVIESEEYAPAVHEEQRISSPVHSDAGDFASRPEIEIEEEDETPRHPESTYDAPYVIESEEYEPVAQEQRISSPVHSEADDKDVIESEVYERHQEDGEEEDPSIVESEEYVGSRGGSVSGSPRPFEDSTTTTVLSVHHEPPAIPEPEVDEEEELEDKSVIESQEYTSGSPLPPTTVTTVEHVEPAEDREFSAKSPTTVTTVESEHLEPEEPYVVESEEYRGSPVDPRKEFSASGSPVPSEKSEGRVATTTTTTAVTQEHFEPEEEGHVIESEEYTGSPVPSEKESHGFIKTTTTTTTVTREHFDDEPVHQAEGGAASPVPSEDSVSRVVETTTTVTKEHFEPEEGVIESQEYTSGSPVPSEEGSSRIIETTTTTVTREHFEPEEEHHIVESREYSATGSPVPSEKSVGRVVETTTTTTVTREHLEEEPTHEAPSSPVPSEEGVSRVVETTTTTVTREHYEPEEESHMVESREYSATGSPVPSDEESHGFIKTTTTTTTTTVRHEPEDVPSPTPSEEVVSKTIETTTTTSSTQERFEPEHDDEESDGEGFGSKMLGFAKKAGMVAGAVVAAPVALAAVGAKTAYDALKKDGDEEEGEHEHSVPRVETHHQEKDDSESEGSFVDHGEEAAHQSLPLHSTEAAFKLSTEDVAEQTAEKLVSEVFVPLDRTLIESEQFRASIESLNRRSPVEQKKSIEDVATEALQNVTKIKYGDPEDVEEPEKEEEEEEWKVYDRHGEVLEEFSTQLTDDVIQEAEGDATTQILMSQADYSPRRSKFLKQESCQEISNEPEVDYYSDLQEKLSILAGEKSNLAALPEEEPSTASDQLDVIHESDQEAEAHRELEEQKEQEEAEERTAIHLVDEVLEQVVQEFSDQEDEDQKTMTSDAYLTADSKDAEYDTCVTSQDDTYESAQGWTSQDSEYTTATSQAPSRLSDDDDDGEHTARDYDRERQETSTPQAILSPVDSDRHFTVQQDFEMPVIRAFDPDDFLQSTARSTPDVALQVTIEEEDESDDKLPISPSGVLLPPQSDPGRPVSPVPPRRDGQEEGVFVFVREEDTIAEPTPPPVPARELVEQTTPRAQEEEEEEEGDDRRQEPERIHGSAMEASSDPANSESARYSRQQSDLSSSAESHADTIIRVEGERSGSSDSLEVVSVISAGKSATPEDPEAKPIVEEKKPQQQQQESEEKEEAEQLGFEVYDADTEEAEQQLPQPIEELETVEEEPEDSDSLNEGGGSGHSSVGVPADTLAMIGKYRHQSSDNLSLSSLQEFERLEKEVGARGDGSLTRSEIELLVAGRLNKSGEGSVSSLAEFERLEKELVENQSPPEDVMMLSDIREESEAEDMSIRDDDEDVEGVGSDTELKSRPVQEDDLRGVTPIAPSPTDSLEHAVDPMQLQYLETSTDSLEPTFQEIEVEQRADSATDTSLAEYEMVPHVMEASTTDSLDGTATMEKDSVLEGASQGIESTQSTHGLLSGDTLGTLVTDDDKDSLDGEVSSMLQSYPTTLTTFQTTVVGPDGTVQTISRRVETRVTDPLVSHVQFTGTESQERLDQLPDDEQFETVDTEGNVTRTTFRREHDEPPRY